MRGRGGKDDSVQWEVPPSVGMPDFNAQPVAAQPAYAAQPSYAAPAATTNFNAQPAVAQPTYVAPVAQPDPARDYYNSLIAQGYPHEDAVRYTQQYFAQFQG